MTTMRLLCSLCVLLLSQVGMAQFTTLLEGSVSLNGTPLQDAHIENVNRQTATITDNKGRFRIEVEKRDLLKITHVTVREQFYVIAQSDIENPYITVKLTEKLETLDELTIKDDNRVTVQSVGIVQGPTKILTPTERRYEAESKVELKDFINFRDTGFQIPLVPFINAISGRTKQLKKHLAADQEMVVFDNLYAYNSEFLAHRFNIEDAEVKQFLDRLIDLPETPAMSREENLDKTRIWLIDKYLEFEKE